MPREEKKFETRTRWVLGRVIFTAEILKDLQRRAGNYLPQEVANNAKKFKPRITGFFNKREQKTKIFVRKAGRKECRRPKRGDGNLGGKMEAKKMRTGFLVGRGSKKRSESFSAAQDWF